MNKQSAMAMVNGYLGHGLLNERNTSFANVNASKAVWWLNIRPERFEDDLHVLLVKEGETGLIWLKIEANAFPFLERVFRKRQDTGAIDLEISSMPSHYMTDVKSGGTGYNFTKHIEHEWGMTEDSNKSNKMVILNSRSLSGFMRMSLMFNIEIEQEADGRWIAEAPEIPGVLVYGITTGEAIAKTQALTLRVLAEQMEHGEPTPAFLDVSFEVT